MATNTSLPEGTDSIISGAAVTGDDDFGTGSGSGFGSATTSSAGGTGGGSFAESIKQQAQEKGGDLRGQAADKARAFALQGKDKATSTLDSVAQMIGDAASQVDEKVGAEYGDHVRRAATSVTAFADQIRGKDVDDLVAEAREFVRRSPALAIGAAAVVGFALVRVLKSGFEAQGASSADLPGGATMGTTPQRPTPPSVSPAA